jgi:hypothetical protein
MASSAALQGHSRGLRSFTWRTDRSENTVYSFKVRVLTRTGAEAPAVDSGAAGLAACNDHGSDYEQIHRQNLLCS